MKPGNNTNGKTFIMLSKNELIELLPKVFEKIGFSTNDVMINEDDPILYLDWNKREILFGFLTDPKCLKYLSENLRLSFPKDYETGAYDIINILGTENYRFIEHSQANQILRVEFISVPNTRGISDENRR